MDAGNAPLPCSASVRGLCPLWLRATPGAGPLACGCPGGWRCYAGPGGSRVLTGASDSPGRAHGREGRRTPWKQRGHVTWPLKWEVAALYSCWGRLVPGSADRNFLARLLRVWDEGAQGWRPLEVLGAGCSVFLAGAMLGERAPHAMVGGLGFCVSSPEGYEAAKWLAPAQFQGPGWRCQGTPARSMGFACFVRVTLRRISNTPGMCGHLTQDPAPAPVPGAVWAAQWTGGVWDGGGALERVLECSSRTLKWHLQCLYCAG